MVHCAATTTTAAHCCMFQAQILREFGGTVLANACGPCIGQWKRCVTVVSQLVVK